MPEFDPKTRDLLVGMLLLAGLLGLAAIGVQIALIYRRRITSRDDFDADLAESLREAFEEGELEPEEYRQIRSAMERRNTAAQAMPPSPLPATDPSEDEPSGSDPPEGADPSPSTQPPPWTERQ